MYHWMSWVTQLTWLNDLLEALWFPKYSYPFEASDLKNALKVAESIIGKKVFTRTSSYYICTFLDWQSDGDLTWRKLVNNKFLCLNINFNRDKTTLKHIRNVNDKQCKW